MFSGHFRSGLLRAVLLTTISVGPVGGQEVDTTTMTVLDFTPEAVEGWYVVNDGVMGGRSSSEIRHEEGDIAVFEGTLSLENNGGFASVRTEITEGTLSGVTALILKIRGDGKRYQLRLRMGRSFDGVAYATSFETTPDRWTTVELPLASFQPTFRGSVPRNARPLDAGRVRQIGIMLTDKQEGRFRLEVAGVDAR